MTAPRLLVIALSLLTAVVLSAGDAAVALPAADGFGPEVKGLRAKITLAKRKLLVGEPIKVAYRVKNVSKVKQVVWHSGFWPNHQVLVRDARGKEPPLTARGQQCRQAFSPGGPRDKNFPLELQPGGEDATEGAYDLTELYDLSRPGRYTVQYIYEEKQGGWEGRLPSNEEGFEIVAKEANVRMAESKPVEVRGLRLTARIPARIAAPPHGETQSVDLGLRVTNVSDTPITLCVNDVLRLHLASDDGEQTGWNVGRDGSPKAKPPVTLKPGASWTWQLEARLGWVGGDRSNLQLSGPDGHGVAGFWSFGTMKHKKYRLSIEYTNTTRTQDNLRLWTGTATTKEAQFEIGARE